MQSASRTTTRFIRFTIWTLMMLTAFVATEAFKPREAFIVPCVFMVLCVPMVLLPIRAKKN